MRKDTNHPAEESAHERRCHALVPAAGSGARMGQGTLPKQYWPLFGKPMIWHALNTLCAVQRIRHVFVVLSPNDQLWPADAFIELSGKLTVLRCGGETRAQSVRNGLAAISNILEGLTPNDDCPAIAQDWVLVHDAARPGLTVDQVDRLIDAVMPTDAGGILAIPVADTLKRACDDAPTKIQGSVGRTHLWQAQTPQMFKHRMLADALEYAQDVTDEASAIEALGWHPILVEGDPSNFKVTYPRDFDLAESILRERKRGQA